MTFRVCAIVPTYNHVSALRRILQELRVLGLEVFVVDDGNESAVAQEIANASRGKGIILTRHRENAGKGAAVITGLKLAAEKGYTHALQVDADGQHDLRMANGLIEAAQREPDALVTAKPVFDETAPLGRRIGRWFTHIWVSINTFSPRVIDSLCGFRVYPVRAALAVADNNPVAKRMGFDIEILVRSVWNGTPVRQVPVRVIYPPGNYSNFRAWDNVEISCVHAKLFFLMLWKAPGRLAARLWDNSTEPSGHWAAIAERGGYQGMCILARLYRIFGRRVCLAVMSPVILFFFLTGRKPREGSLDYLERAWKAGALPKRPGQLTAFRHFSAFGAAALDKFAAWTGNIPLASIEGISGGEFENVERSGKGVFVLTAHLGNSEVIRALATIATSLRVTVLVHTVHAVEFNKLINRVSNSSTVGMIQVTEVGPDTAIRLKAAIDRGEWVVMVGDRVPVTGNARVSWTPFLGELAPFAQGPHILGAVLQCPVYLMFCLRTKRGFKVYFEKFSDQIVLKRAERVAAIEASVARYAQRLEHYLRLAPLQWFNFFDYWRPTGLTPPERHKAANANPSAVRS